MIGRFLKTLGWMSLMAGLVVVAYMFTVRPVPLAAIETQPPMRMHAPESALSPSELTTQKRDELMQKALANIWRYTPSSSAEPPELLQVTAQNGQIAYVGEDGAALWLVNPDGTAARQVLTGLVNAAQPAWSHDSQALAFVAQASDGTGCVYRLNIGAAAQTILACGFTSVALPQWSPDDSRVLVFGEHDPVSGPKAWVIPSGGGQPTVLGANLTQEWLAGWVTSSSIVVPGMVATDVWRLHVITLAAPDVANPITPEFRCSDECNCGTGDDWLAYPQTSPAGDRIAFVGAYTVGNKTSCTAYYAVYTVDPAGTSAPNKIVDIADSSSGLATASFLRWAANNQSVAVGGGGSDAVMRLRIVNVATYAQTILHGREGGSWSMWDWAPDATRLTAGHAPSGGASQVYNVTPTDVWDAIAAGREPAWGQLSPPTAVNVEATGLEVTQAIQTDDSDIPLVQNKRTFVRLSARSASGDVENVAALLTLTHNGATRVLKPLKQPLTVYADGGTRRNVDHTFNFEIPLEWTMGSVQMRAEIIPLGNRYDPDLTNNSYPRASSAALERTFNQRGRLEVATWRLTITKGGKTYTPTAGASDGSLTWVRAVYPLAESDTIFNERGTLVVGTPISAGSWGDSQMGTMVSALSTECIKGKSSTERLCYGWIDPDAYPGGFMGYAAIYTEQTTTGPQTYRVAVGLADKGRITAHEIGHTLNRNHAVGCNAQPSYDYSLTNFGIINPEVGYTIWGQNDQQAYGKDPTEVAGCHPAKNYYDFMSYAGVNEGRQWVTPHTYKALYNALPQTASLVEPAGDDDAQTLSAYLVVSGLILPGNSIQLNPLYRQEFEQGSFDEAGSGRYQIVLRDGSGAALFTRAFNLTSDGYGGGETAFFLQIVPYNPAAVELLILDGSTTLGRVAASQHAPQVTVTAPAAGANLAGKTTLAWTAQDADGNPLSFLVEFSADGGQHWHTVAVDVQGQHVEVDTSWWPQTTQGVIRVSASDGLHTTAAISSGYFQVQPKVPQVRIITPEDGAQLRPDLSFNLVGTAQDPEDGILEAEALTWLVDGQPVGVGSVMGVGPLATGAHTIALQARDSDGHSSIASITVYVGSRVYLPIVVRR